MVCAHGEKNSSHTNQKFTQWVELSWRHISNAVLEVIGGGELGRKRKKLNGENVDGKNTSNFALQLLPVTTEESKKLLTFRVLGEGRFSKSSRNLIRFTHVRLLDTNVRLIRGVFGFGNIGNMGSFSFARALPSPVVGRPRYSSSPVCSSSSEWSPTQSTPVCRSYGLYMNTAHLGSRFCRAVVFGGDGTRI